MSQLDAGLKEVEGSPIGELEDFHAHSVKQDSLARVKIGLSQFLSEHSEFSDRLVIRPDELKAGETGLVPGFLPGYWMITDSVAPMGFPIAQEKFKPASVKPGKAFRFFEKWRSRLIEPVKHEYAFDDYVLVALTDDISAPTDHLGVDSVEMIEDVLRLEPERPVVVRHANGTKYSEVDQERLNKFELSDRLNFSRGHIDRLLGSCAYVVTQDSDVADQALLHRKSAIHYSHKTLHHLARKSFEEKRIQRCFNRVKLDRPEFEEYLYWAFSEFAVDATGAFGSANVYKALKKHLL